MTSIAGLCDSQQKGVGELSGGWRMKLAIARSMLWNARILLLDEPTNHLDKAAVAWLVEKINSLVDTTVLLVSHDYDFLKLVRGVSCFMKYWHESWHPLTPR